jgi:hypothetical protein
MVAPSQALFQHFVDEARRASMFLLGRCMYDLMAASWPTADTVPGQTDARKEYSRIWTDNACDVGRRPPECSVRLRRGARPYFNWLSLLPRRL